MQWANTVMAAKDAVLGSVLKYGPLLEQFCPVAKGLQKGTMYEVEYVDEDYILLTTKQHPDVVFRVARR